MIVSDSEKFVFVHNPKCGGMSCHNTLLKYDTRDNLFFEWRPVNPAGKILDMAHITPFQMRRFFPKAFEEVQGYVKFTFVRDPYQRFMSAVSQHLKLGTHFMRQAIIDEPDVFYAVAARFALSALKTRDVENEHKLVHFRLQCNFANIDGRRWVDHVFHLEDHSALRGTPVEGWLPDMFSNKANRTSDRYDSGYDAERLGTKAIAALNTFYARDFETFDYKRI